MLRCETLLPFLCCNIKNYATMTFRCSETMAWAKSLRTSHGLVAQATQRADKGWALCALPGRGPLADCGGALILLLAVLSKFPFSLAARVASRQAWFVCFRAFWVLAGPTDSGTF
mmetsp:Transcript_16808/g.29519  ORF Transcript_16808/g.29519 Transcript_16808/m.29519 type:complete len:115 (-) Transcript_16808:3333-3677(-)